MYPVPTKGVGVTVATDPPLEKYLLRRVTPSPTPENDAIILHQKMRYLDPIAL
jgi:hypothetical protein